MQRTPRHPVTEVRGVGGEKEPDIVLSQPYRGSFCTFTLVHWTYCVSGLLGTAPIVRYIVKGRPCGLEIVREQNGFPLAQFQGEPSHPEGESPF